MTINKRYVTKGKRNRSAICNATNSSLIKGYLDGWGGYHVNKYSPHHKSHKDATPNVVQEETEIDDFNYQARCPACNKLIFRFSQNLDVPQKIQIKCSRCKQLIWFKFIQ